jgi:hypothetical protein
MTFGEIHQILMSPFDFMGRSIILLNILKYEKALTVPFTIRIKEKINNY